MKLIGFHHICIQTEDYHASVDFYVNLLGFELYKENEGFHSRAYNTWLRAGKMYIELQTPKTNTEFLPWSSNNSGPVHICVCVDDVHAAYDKLKSTEVLRFKQKRCADGEIKELYQVEGSYLFKVHAPEGTEVEVRSDPNIS